MASLYSTITNSIDPIPPGYTPVIAKPRPKLFPDAPPSYTSVVAKPRRKNDVYTFTHTGRPDLVVPKLKQAECKLRMAQLHKETDALIVTIDEAKLYINSDNISAKENWKKILSDSKKACMKNILETAVHQMHLYSNYTDANWDDLFQARANDNPEIQARMKKEKEKERRRELRLQRKEREEEEERQEARSCEKRSKAMLAQRVKDAEWAAEKKKREAEEKENRKVVDAVANEFKEWKKRDEEKKRKRDESSSSSEEEEDDDDEPTESDREFINDDDAVEELWETAEMYKKRAQEGRARREEANKKAKVTVVKGEIVRSL